MSQRRVESSMIQRITPLAPENQKRSRVPIAWRHPFFTNFAQFLGKVQIFKKRACFLQGIFHRSRILVLNPFFGLQQGYSLLLGAPSSVG